MASFQAIASLDESNHHHIEKYVQDNASSVELEAVKQGTIFCK
jgi:hypothetical protein